MAFCFLKSEKGMINRDYWRMTCLDKNLLPCQMLEVWMTCKVINTILYQAKDGNTIIFLSMTKRKVVNDYHHSRIMRFLSSKKKIIRVKHCVKSVQVLSFWSVFSCIQSEYRKIENTDQEKLRIWTLFMQWKSMQFLIVV